MLSRVILLVLNIALELKLILVLDAVLLEELFQLEIEHEVHELQEVVLGVQALLVSRELAKCAMELIPQQLQEVLTPELLKHYS